ncbi:unnamed protein product [Cuscuta epithymum]|uniref:Uncharacterized protein n=1 Tax=Cuscuta epithymum TaxID=186058 RepID=A0AAV0F2R6_9ASTE|nr:unnamed protein product [Cuscuta epithymum]
MQGFGRMIPLESLGFHLLPFHYREGICLLVGTTVFENPLMAEDDDRSRTDLNEKYVNNEEASTSYYCKDCFANSSTVVQEDDGHKDWLQLTVGGGGGNNSATVSHDGRDHEEHGRTTRLGPVELDLLPSGRSSGSYASTAAELRLPLPIPPPTAVGYISSTLSNYNNFLHHPPWAFWPVMATPPQGLSVAGSSSSSPFLYAPPLTCSPSRPAALPLLYAGAGVVSPGFDCRVIDPPRRQHSGIWFSLQASQNQRKEPYLRQISKKYIRIKDGRMTILLVLKYLVNKLRLENESEIEITCRGQELLPSLTLQHVRDEIWMRNYLLHPNLLTFVATNHHVMVLLYGRK